MQATDWIDLSGKTAHVTGAGHGIGAAIARALAMAGAKVAVSDIDVAADRRSLGGHRGLSHRQAAGRPLGRSH